MFLKELESKYQIKYPELFRELYFCGSMDWLKHDYDWIKNNYEIISNDPNAFFTTIAFDCRPIPFQYVEEIQIEMLKAIINFNMYADDKKIINPNYTIIPFSKTARGDIYNFLYETKTNNPCVVRFQHDTCDLETWNNDFEEFVFDELFNTVHENNVNLNDERIEFILRKMKPIYQQKMIDYTPEKLSDYYDSVDLPKELNLFVDKYTT